MNVDAGINFGKWGDPTSRFLYEESMFDILPRIQFFGTVADYGGGNGLLKNYVPGLITIDKDVEKKPDIVDDILTHSNPYDIVVLRYVLHYLTDYEVLALMQKLLSNGVQKVLIIQFTNEDLISKYKCSINEKKYFRTLSQLKALLNNQHPFYTKEYEVDPDFYQNRLGITIDFSHEEQLNAFYVDTFKLTGD